MIVLIYTVIGFCFGSVPFAFYLARVAVGADAREFGEDRNPGAVNAWKAAGWKVGLPGGILDLSKGLLPVFFAQHVSHLAGWALVPIAIAPVLGHAFSPLLHFHGGKALAASFGMWAGLTNGLGFLAFAGTCGVFWGIQEADAWSTFFGHLGLLAFLLMVQPQGFLLTLWVMETAVVTWKHRHDLREPIQLRPWLTR